MAEIMLAWQSGRFHFITMRIVGLLLLPLLIVHSDAADCSHAKNLALRLLCHIGQVDLRNLRSADTYVQKPHPVVAPPTVPPVTTTPQPPPTTIATTTPTTPETKTSKYAGLLFKEELMPTDHVQPPEEEITTTPPFYSQVLSFTKPNRTNYENSEVCYGCMASTISESDFPNENCSRDFASVESAVEMGIGFATCLNGCYTSVLRLGQYITTFRGCRSEILAGSATVQKGNYDCAVSDALGTKWWTCTCRGHFCNAKLPNV